MFNEVHQGPIDHALHDHYEDKSALLQIYDHPDWLRYNKTLLSNATIDSLGVPWLPSSLDEPIEIGRLKNGNNRIGDIFDVSWRKPVPAVLAPSPGYDNTLYSLSEAGETFVQDKVDLSNETNSSVAWTFGSCPLIIPDHSFEGEQDSHSHLN